MDLDEMLTRAAPRREHTPETSAALREMVDASRSTARSRHRVRLITAGAVVVAALGGTAAAAGAVPASWIPWTTPANHQCHMQFTIDPSRDGEGETNMLPEHINKARQTQELAAARDFLAGFDYASIDQDRAIADYRALQRRLSAKGIHNPPEHGDELALSAVSRVVWDSLNAHLTELGYDMRPVKGSDLFVLVGASAWKCD